MMAALALGYLKEPSVVASLRMRLTDSDPMVARAARKALYDIHVHGDLRKTARTRPNREKKETNPLAASSDVWYWRIFFLVIAGLIGLFLLEKCSNVR